MTFIEFFDKTASKNIIVSLAYSPDRVIYIGGSAKLMKKHIANYQRLFSDRGQKIEFLYRTVSKSNLRSAVDLLSEIVETYDDCVFDITGGEEILTFASGVVYAKYPHRNIQIHKFNLRNNGIYDCDEDGSTILRTTPTLSVEENIRIYGGEVIYGFVDEDKTYRWDLNHDFLNDVNLIWDICKKDVRCWNTQIGILDTAEKIGCHSEDRLTTVVSRTELEQKLAKFKTKYSPANVVYANLLKKGLLTRFDDDGTTVTIAYKNVQVKKCLTKAGQALEMKIYVSAKGISDKDGAPVYNDALNGIVIDWDGELHDEEAEEVFDTENEIDVLLMHGVVPVFISCKNGKVTADELYKLNTVAERFGGQYSKKVLVATLISAMGERGEYLRQRAADMGIKLIEDVQSLDDAELEKKLRNLWNS